MRKKGQLALFSHGCSRIIKDPGAIRKIQDIDASTPGFEIVEERGAFVLAGDLDENKNEQKPESGPVMPLHEDHGRLRDWLKDANQRKANMNFDVAILLLSRAL